MAPLVPEDWEAAVITAAVTCRSYQSLSSVYIY